MTLKGTQNGRHEWAAIMGLGVPIVVGQIGTIVLSFADTIMIGHHSTPELAAAAFVSNLFALGILVAMGFAYGLTPLVGRAYGSGDVAAIGRLVKNALAAGGLLALLLTGAFGVLYFCLGHLGQPEELLPFVRPYYLCNLASLPFVCLFNVFKQTADGITHTRLPMWVLIGGNLLNIAGNWALIYGHWGAPELGLLGAGLSTLASRIVMAVVMVGVFFCARRYRPYRAAFGHSRVGRADFLLLNRMGWPLSLQMSMEGGAWSLAGIIVGWIGTIPLAGHQVMLSVSQLFYQFYYAIGAAACIRVSLFLGLKSPQRIPAAVWAGYHINLGVAVVMSALVLLFRHDIGALFSNSPAVQAAVAGAVVPLVVYQLVDGLQCVLSNALRGLQCVRPLVPVAFVSYFVVSLPLSYLFGIAWGGGLAGVWWAFPFGLSVAAGLYYRSFRHRMRRLMAATAPGASA